MLLANKFWLHHCARALCWQCKCQEEEMKLIDARYAAGGLVHLGYIEIQIYVDDLAEAMERRKKPGGPRIFRMPQAARFPVGTRGVWWVWGSTWTTRASHSWLNCECTRLIRRKMEKIRMRRTVSLKKIVFVLKELYILPGSPAVPLGPP